MITLYAACLRRLGLSQEEAETVHARFGQAVRRDTINSWSSGRREPPPGAFEDLRAYARVLNAAKGRPADLAEALYLAENASASVADRLGLAGVNSLLVALAAGYLES